MIQVIKVLPLSKFAFPPYRSKSLIFPLKYWGSVTNGNFIFTEEKK